MPQSGAIVQRGNCNTHNLRKSISDIDDPKILTSSIGRWQYLCNQRNINAKVGAKANPKHSSS